MAELELSQIILKEGTQSTVLQVADSESRQNKLDKVKSVSVTVSADGWQEEDESTAYEDYPYCYDIEIDGLTDADMVAVIVSTESQAVGASAGICATNESMDGKVRIRAMAVPSEDLAVAYWVFTGASDGSGND